MRKVMAFTVMLAMFFSVGIGQVWSVDFEPKHEHFDRIVTGPARLRVRVFNFSTAPDNTVTMAMAETSRIFTPVHIAIEWINCSRSADLCTSPTAQVDVLIRILATALPQANKLALGLTSRSDSGSTAAVFYDRALSVRTDRIFPAQILGRAMAHEIIHVLLPSLPHLDRGLMKAKLTVEDFRIGCLQCPPLAGDLLNLIRREVDRRSDGVLSENSNAHLP